MYVKFSYAQSTIPIHVNVCLYIEVFIAQIQKYSYLNSDVFIYEMFSIWNTNIHVKFISWNIHAIQVHAINRPNTNGSSPNLQHQLRAGAVYFQTRLHTHLYIDTSIHIYKWVFFESASRTTRRCLVYIQIHIRTQLRMYTCTHDVWVLSEAASRQTSRCLAHNIYVSIFIYKQKKKKTKKKTLHLATLRES